MITLPINELDSLLKSITKDILLNIKMLYHTNLNINDLKLLYIYILEDSLIGMKSEGRLFSPLTILIFGCNMELLKTTYYVNHHYTYLIDKYALCIIGNGTRVSLVDKPIFYKDGIKGINQFNMNSYGSTDYEGFRLDKFLLYLISSRVSKEQELTPYESWILEFLGKRQALILMDDYISNSGLINTPPMKAYKDEIEIKREGLIEDISDLRVNHPMEVS